MATSILAPVLYLFIVVGGLFTFSSVYKKRMAHKHLEPYFPSHPERDTYVTLLQMTDPPAPDSVLKSALIQRACADVRRVLRIREDKPALQSLIQKGCVGDEIWEALNAAEKETEAEVLEVMHEANSFLMGWGQFIFNTAAEMVTNEQTRSLLIEKYPVMRAEAERKYRGVKKQPNGTPEIKTEVKNEPSPSLSASPASSPPAASQPSLTSSPKNAATVLLNGKLAPPSNDSESVGSMSDGEAASPGSSKKQGNKKGKNKKRK